MGCAPSMPRGREARTDRRRRSRPGDAPSPVFDMVAASASPKESPLTSAAPPDVLEPLYRKALKEKTEHLGADHPDTLYAMNALAIVLHKEAQFNEAEMLYRDVLAKRVVVLGNEHVDTIATMNNLASLLHKRDGAELSADVRAVHLEQAETLYRACLKTCRTTYGESHKTTLHAKNNLASLLWEKQRFGEAEGLFRETVASAFMA